MNTKHTPEQARSDLSSYARAMRIGNHTAATRIEEAWDLFGCPPEIVSEILACVATGLPLDAAHREVMRSAS